MAKTPVLPGAIANAQLEVTAAPPKKRGRSGTRWEEWVELVTELRGTDPGTTYQFHGIEKPASLAQGFKEFFGLCAGSNSVDKDTKIGTLWIQNRELEEDDNSSDTSYTDSPE